MKDSIRTKTMPADSIRAGMVVQTNVFLGVKGWRVVTFTMISPSGGVRFELNKDGKANNPVMYDNHKRDDQVVYRVDTNDEPITVEVEDRLKKT